MATNEIRRASLARIFKTNNGSQQFSDLSKMDSAEIVLRPKLLKQSQIETPPQTPKLLQKNG